MPLLHQSLILDGASLTLDDLYAVQSPNIQVQIAEPARIRVQRHWKMVCQTVETALPKCIALKKQCQTLLSRPQLTPEEQEQLRQLELELTYHSIYGVNTGFGQLKVQGVETRQAMQDLQNNIIRSHACGVGELLPDSIVRMMMALRVNTLVRAQSGIRLETLERFLTLLNHNILPEVPAQGSVGASGDLAPLAHMTLLLLGEGPIRAEGKRWVVSRFAQPPADLQALFQSIGIPLRYTLDYKEGLSLTNGTTCMTAIATVAWIEAVQTVKASLVASSLTLEALLARTRAFDAVVHLQRPHPGQKRVAELFYQWLKGSELVNQWPHVHDAYSIRCIPQVLGASIDQLNHIRSILEIEINSTVDDPLFFLPEDLENTQPLDGWNERIHYEQGHFHGEPVAMAMDLLKIAVAEVGSIAERRIQHLLDHHHNRGLSGCLLSAKALQEGSHSGLLIPQYTAAALVSENKVLAHPASVDSIPTSANHEDHVSMGTIAARQALAMVQNTRKVIAIEFLCAIQALRLRFLEPRYAQKKMAPETRKFWDLVQEQFPFLEEDRVLAEDMERMEHFMNGSLSVSLRDLNLFSFHNKS
ncbi:MAG: aromatic amino acid lyase [Planctomycetota bacterium]